MAKLHIPSRFSRPFTSAVSRCFIWLCAAFVFLSFAPPHPYFLSMTEIKYNAGTSSLEVSVKVFTNDMEEAMRKAYNTEVNLFKPKNQDMENRLVSDYVRKNVLIAVNGKPVAMQMVGYEKEEDAVWVFLESGRVEKPTKMEVDDKLLYASFPAQINMVSVEVGSNRQSAKASNPESKFSFSFQ